MKPTQLLLASTCLALAVLCGIARAQTTNLVYQETFSVPKPNNQMVTNVGWIQDIGGSYGPARIFSGVNNHGVTFPVCAVNTYDDTAPQTNAWYYTTATANGGPYDLPPGDGLGPVSNKMTFPGINLAMVQNLSYTVMANNGPGAGEQIHWAVQMNNNQWYVSTNFFINASGNAFQTYTMYFNPAASGWNLLTVSGHCTFTSLNTNVVIGPPAAADLTGYITGGGLVPVFTDTGGNIQFNNYSIFDTTISCLPVFGVQPLLSTNIAGTTATFTVGEYVVGHPVPTSFQWMAGAIGSGVYSNLYDGGQITGSTSNVLQISNVTSANQLDYVVVGSNECGSVTSSPPARLWVVDSAPILTNETFIYPDNATNLGSTIGLSIHAGNHNVMNLTASFIGSPPINYQWQFSPTNDGTGVVSVPGATNTMLTLSNPPTGAGGYYRLSASNSESLVPTNSSWVQLTILPASTSQIQWSAKVPFTGLTAAQILNGTPGVPFEAESFGGPSSLSVTNGTNVISFDTTGTSATLSGGYTPYGSGQFVGTTDDTNLDQIFGADTECISGAIITLNNLTVDRRYSAQLFAFNDVAVTDRQANFSDSNDAADVSQSFAMGDNVYVVGTFTATNTTQTISLNGDSGCYLCCVIVRALAATPAIRWSGSNLEVNWDYGTLLEATNLAGPWTTNAATPPYLFNPTNPALFFRTQFP